MVKAQISPAVITMTGFAGLLRIILFADKAFMYIIMAICAGNTYFPKGPTLLFFIQMTGKTGRGCVGPFQGKFTFIVFFQSKKTRCKTIHRVAICTVGAIAPAFGKLLLMIVRMAGRTGIVRQRIGHFF